MKILLLLFKLVVLLLNLFQLLDFKNVGMRSDILKMPVVSSQIIHYLIELLLELAPSFVVFLCFMFHGIDLLYVYSFLLLDLIHLFNQLLNAPFLGQYLQHINSIQYFNVLLFVLAVLLASVLECLNILPLQFKLVDPSRLLLDGSLNQSSLLLNFLIRLLEVNGAR